MSASDERPPHVAWSSALSTNDFAACVEAGIEPVGFVQGCSVISWGWGTSMMSPRGVGFGGAGYGTTQGYSEQYPCPHGFVSAEHRMYGMNFEQVWAEDAWHLGYSSSYGRLVNEAHKLGAHGVIGILDSVEHDPESSAYRFTIQGTAVKVAGAGQLSSPFTTYLAGQKLNKLFEAGFAPVSVVADFVSVQVYASCMTEFMLYGRGGFGWGQSTGGEVEQLTRAQSAARHLIRERVRSKLEGDVLHAAHLEIREREVGGSGPQVDAILKGNRVRRFKDYDPVPLPRPVVRLVDT